MKPVASSTIKRVKIRTLSKNKSRFLEDCVKRKKMWNNPGKREIRKLSLNKKCGG